MSWLQKRNASPMQADRCSAVPWADAGLALKAAASSKMLPIMIVDCLCVLIFALL